MHKRTVCAKLEYALRSLNWLETTPTVVERVHFKVNEHDISFADLALSLNVLHILYIGDSVKFNRINTSTTRCCRFYDFDCICFSRNEDIIRESDSTLYFLL